MIKLLTNPAFWWILGGVVVGLILLHVLFCILAGYVIYDRTLKRKNKDMWSRTLPPKIDPDQKPMYAGGFEWSRENAEFKHDVHIVNEGYNLYGEYYDFGNKRCAVILSGRTESLVYGYYFAIPYAKNGFNVLVLDPRSHGLSDGEFNTIGFEESKDTVAWIKYIRSTYGIESFVLHGICIGAANGMFALNSPDCPDCVDGIVTEGMFARFRESVKNHIKESKGPVFITLGMVDVWMRYYTGHSMKRGPINIIENVKTPLLMLHSKEDKYSTPEFAQKLYDLSGSIKKEIVWFDHGRHSMLRVTDTEKYDASITRFITEIYADQKDVKENGYVL